MEYIIQPNQNGILLFILGSLFVLSIYHLFLFIQNKDISYLFYSLFTFLICLTYGGNTHGDFLDVLTQPISEELKRHSFFLVWLYNSVYYFFGIQFIDLRKHNKRWYHIIRVTVICLLIIGGGAQLCTNLFNEPKIIYNAYVYFFLPFITVFSLITLYVISRVKNKLKYFLVIGSFILLLTSMIATVLVVIYRIAPYPKLGSLIFYSGLIIENIFFSLCLGYKQKILAQEKNKTQEHLIIELKKNKQLQHKLEQELRTKINVLTKQVDYEQEITDLKLSTLRNQMNPHFLFNSLNSIKHFIINNQTKDAVSYLNKFAKLIREILNAYQRKETSLADELRTIELYLNIENIRFDNSIEHTIDIGKEVMIEQVYVPSLMLQPFIENAIWHGLSLKKGKKKINITIKKENENHVTISVRDNGVGREYSMNKNKNKSTSEKSVGLKLTEERLTHFSKKFTYSYSIIFCDHKDNQNQSLGTEVIIQIPIK